MPPNPLQNWDPSWERSVTNSNWAPKDLYVLASHSTCTYGCALGYGYALGYWCGVGYGSGCGGRGE
jgi:hypothetical protein